MSGDAQPPPALHRSFLVFQHIASKLRKTHYKSSFESDVAAGFDIMLQGKTLRDWAPNLLTLLGKDITSTCSPSSSSSTRASSKTTLSTPIFESKLLVDCAAAADAPYFFDMSSAVVERVLQDHSPLSFNEALKSDLALSTAAIKSNGDHRVMQFLLTDSLGAREQILERHRVLSHAKRFFGLPLKPSFFPASFELLDPADDNNADAVTTRMQRQLDSFSDAIGNFKSDFKAAVGAMDANFSARIDDLSSCPTTDPSILSDIVSVAVAEALTNNTTLNDLRGRADEHNIDMAELRAGLYELQSQQQAPSPAPLLLPSTTTPPPLTSVCPRPAWATLEPECFNSSRCETPRIDSMWRAAPRGEDITSKAQRKALAVELANDKLLSRLPEPTVDASATLAYCEVRHFIIEDMFGYAYLLYSETSLLRALQRCATDRQQSAKPRFAPLWRRLASAPDLLTFVKYMDRLYQDTNGDMTQLSWNKAVDGAVDGIDLLGRLRPLMNSADNIDRARDVITNFLAKRNDKDTIAELQRASPVDIDAWEAILAAAVTAERVVNSYLLISHDIAAPPWSATPPLVAQ